MMIQSDVWWIEMIISWMYIIRILYYKGWLVTDLVRESSLKPDLQVVFIFTRELHVSFQLQGALMAQWISGACWMEQRFAKQPLSCKQTGSGWMKIHLLLFLQWLNCFFSFVGSVSLYTTTTKQHIEHLLTFKQEHSMKFFNTGKRKRRISKLQCILIWSKCLKI